MNLDDIFLEDNIKAFIRFLDPTREEILIEGKNPRYPQYAEWFNGYVPSFHEYVGMKRGEEVPLVREQTNLASMICQSMASSFANEDLTITLGTNETSQNTLNEILKRNSFLKNWGKFVAKYQGLGIGATIVLPVNKSLVNDAKNTEVKISFIDASRVYPVTREDDSITEIAIVRYNTNKVIIQVHIKVEEEYICAETYSSRINGVWTLNLDKEKIKVVTSPIPLFQIWMPNLPNTKNQAVDVSRFDVAIPYIKQADVEFDSFFTEFKNGKKKRFVSASTVYVDENGNMKGTLADDEEIIIPKDLSDATLIQEFNAELRVEAHLRAMNAMFNLAYQASGLGDATFTIDGGSGRPLQTATAVIAKESKMGRTIIEEEHVATDNLEKMVEAICYVSNEFTNNPTMTYDINKFQVMYADNIIEDETSKREAMLKEVQTGITSKAEYRAMWKDEDIDTALQYLQENAMLDNDYLASVSNGLMTPEEFVDKAKGMNYPYREQLIANLKMILQPVQEVNFALDESDVEENKNNNEENEEESVEE